MFLVCCTCSCMLLSSMELLKLLKRRYVSLTAIWLFFCTYQHLKEHSFSCRLLSSVVGETGEMGQEPVRCLVAWCVNDSWPMHVLFIVHSMFFIIFWSNQKLMGTVEQIAHKAILWFPLVYPTNLARSVLTSGLLVVHSHHCSYLLDWQYKPVQWTFHLRTS
jgi:hypothetical protein